MLPRADRTSVKSPPKGPQFISWDTSMCVLLRVHGANGLHSLGGLVIVDATLMFQYSSPGGNNCFVDS